MILLVTHLFVTTTFLASPTINYYNSHHLCNDNPEGDILVHLLAGHVQLHVQSHDLLLHEPEVFADFKYMMNIQYSGRRLVDQVNGDWYILSGHKTKLYLKLVSG